MTTRPSATTKESISKKPSAKLAKLPMKAAKFLLLSVLCFLGSILAAKAMILVLWPFIKPPF